jgi:Flp pilus assembly pilin Flp
MVRNPWRTLQAIVSADEGVTSLEYAVLAFGIIIAVTAAVTLLRAPLLAAFAAIGSSL